MENYHNVCTDPSDSNVTSELWLVDDKASGIVMAVFLLLILVVGLPWNLLVVAIIVKQRLYTQPTIILLLSLVITDLILLVFHLPLVIIAGFYGEYLFGNSDRVRCSVCRTGCILVLFSLNSIFTISLMSIDRFLFIHKPMHYERYVTMWRTIAVVGVAWLIAAVVAILPAAVGFGFIAYSDLFAACTLEVLLENSYYPVLVFLVGSVAIIPIIVCNLWVCCIVQRNIRAIYSIRKSIKISTSIRIKAYRSMKKKRIKKETHLVKVFGALLGSNLVTWLPLIILFILYFAKIVSIYYVVIATVLFQSQTVVHPIIESALIKEVKVPLRRILLYSYTLIRAKLKHASNENTFSSENGLSSEYHRDECETENSRCCGCDFVTTCEEAVVFSHHHNTNDTEASEL
jgi:hypothetical protein